MAEHRLKEEKEREERIKSQRFTGREIFALEGFVAVDDNRYFSNIVCETEIDFSKSLTTCSLPGPVLRTRMRGTMMMKRPSGLVLAEKRSSHSWI